MDVLRSGDSWNGGYLFELFFFLPKYALIYFLFVSLGNELALGILWTSLTDFSIKFKMGNYSPIHHCLFNSFPLSFKHIYTRIYNFFFIYSRSEECRCHHVWIILLEKLFNFRPAFVFYVTYEMSCTQLDFFSNRVLRTIVCLYFGRRYNLERWCILLITSSGCCPFIDLQ